jgi:hypothetical protein
MQQGTGILAGSPIATVFVSLVSDKGPQQGDTYLPWTASSLNVSKLNELLSAAFASPSTMTFSNTPQTVGFMGMGIMGEAMARNLLKSGKFAKVYVWNRTLSKVGVGALALGASLLLY